MARIRVGSNFYPNNTKTTLDLLAESHVIGSFNNVPSEISHATNGDTYYYAVSSDFPEIASILNYSSFSSLASALCVGGVDLPFTPEEIFTCLATGSNEALTLTALSSTQYKIESSTLRLKFDSDGFSSLNFSTENINTPNNGENNGGIVQMKKSDLGYVSFNGNGKTSLNSLKDVVISSTDALPETTAALKTVVEDKAKILNYIYAEGSCGVSEVPSVMPPTLGDSVTGILKVNFPLYSQSAKNAEPVDLTKVTVIFDEEDPQDTTNNISRSVTFVGVPVMDPKILRERLEGVYDEVGKEYRGSALECLYPNYKKFSWMNVKLMNQK